jgi:hypothetical protein
MNKHRSSKLVIAVILLAAAVCMASAQEDQDGAAPGTVFIHLLATDIRLRTHVVISSSLNSS